MSAHPLDSNPPPAMIAHSRNPTNMPTPPLILSTKAQRTHDSPINGLIAAKLANPPSSTSPPAWSMKPPSRRRSLRITHRIFTNPAHAAGLQYGTTIGLRPLRETLLNHLAALDNKTPNSSA